MNRMLLVRQPLGSACISMPGAQLVIGNQLKAAAKAGLFKIMLAFAISFIFNLL